MISRARFIPESEADVLHAIKRWLAIVCVMILVMVTIGGVTRLTGSGLSITDWAPIMGAIPPLSEEQWLEAFAKYQASPQYQKVNFGMSLPEFKWIFFWEYLHRLWGRLIGLAYALPFFWFVAVRRVRGTLAWKLALGLLLGGLQGVVGWIMVKSGLIDIPRVSHYRLALHLSLALGVLAYLLWLFWGLGRPWREPSHRSKSLVQWANAFLAILGLQIVYGAFVAGLRAGLIHNTFPFMDGEWIPSGITALVPFWLNFLENPSTIQFVHRLGAWALLAMAVYFFLRLRRAPMSRSQQRASTMVMHSTGTQFVIGVLTLLWKVPLFLGALHQVMACVVLGSVFYFQHTLRFRHD